MIERIKKFSRTYLCYVVIQVFIFNYIIIFKETDILEALIQIFFEIIKCYLFKWSYNHQFISYWLFEIHSIRICSQIMLQWIINTYIVHKIFCSNLSSDVMSLNSLFFFFSFTPGVYMKVKLYQSGQDKNSTSFQNNAFFFFRDKFFLSYKSAVYKLNNIPRMNIVFRFLYIIHHKMILYVLKDQSLVLILLDSSIGENVREGSWVAFFVCHYRWSLCLCLI